MKLSENTSSYQKVHLDWLLFKCWICPSGQNLKKTYSESDEKRRLSDAGVSNKQNFKEVIAKKMKR